MFPRKSWEVLDGHPIDARSAVIAFTWYQALRRFSGASTRSIRFSPKAGSMTLRRKTVAWFGPGFVESVLPPPCPPGSVLHFRPWERAESYYDLC
jgi:hypothetical protein